MWLGSIGRTLLGVIVGYAANAVLVAATEQRMSVGGPCIARELLNFSFSATHATDDVAER
jgi:hypothetical protein